MLLVRHGKLAELRDVGDVAGLLALDFHRQHLFRERDVGDVALAWIIHEPTAADADLPISAALR